LGLDSECGRGYRCVGVDDFCAASIVDVTMPPPFLGLYTYVVAILAPSYNLFDSVCRSSMLSSKGTDKVVQNCYYHTTGGSILAANT
jgi:hypothetical protein